MENAQQGQVNLFRIDVGRAAVIPVIEEEKKYTVKHHCTKCDNDDAYFRELREDRFSDEQSGGLYTCTRCGETEKVQ
ncbi:MAG: hypothetical protein M1160_01290 [Candidatus Marsarchaeota archaeon]|jgi:DNA-directed RNA polymerase subunit M/transcription elongation factor TFIIS|nr:hypothetical protein [Candidatus Marsarchaeota archaeon]